MQRATQKPNKSRRVPPFATGVSTGVKLHPEIDSPAMHTRKSAQATLTERALRMLATREHSRFELRRKLLRRRVSNSSRAHAQTDTQVDETTDKTTDKTTDEATKEATKETRTMQVETVLDDLASRDLLSDVRFAQAFVRRGVDRGHGPIKIRAELRNRGVAEDVIDDTLTYPDDFWLCRARAVQAKRFGSGNSDADTPADRSDWARRARYLAARGFASDIIYRTLGPQTV